MGFEQYIQSCRVSSICDSRGDDHQWNRFQCAGDLHCRSGLLVRRPLLQSHDLPQTLVGGIVVMSLFDALFGINEKPIRRALRLVVSRDKKGKQRMVPVEGESVVLSPEGSIDSIQFTPQSFYHCGCSTESPIGGQCGEPSCENISCRQCHGRCALCQKPLCLQCSHYWSEENGETARLCRQCHDESLRKQKWHAIVQGVLHPIQSARKAAP